MALANKTVNYTPFNKTSWGFNSTDLSGTHSGLTNVKVVITVKSGTNQWDNTGHISTPTSGSAVASYNKDKLEWSCSGPLADVDAVLVALDLFPADFPAIRTYDATTNPTGWTNQPTKPNETDGDFPSYGGISEEPEDDAAIPDTIFDLKVYDADNLSAGVVTGGAYEITFDAIHPTFGKQRPYWSTEPSNEDASSADFSLSTGGLLDLGEISQLNPTTNVSDDDPLTLTCEFRSFGVISPTYSGAAYGTLTTTSDGTTNKIFIGNKKSGAENTSQRVNFTGTRAEVQAYLDNVRYYRGVGATPSVTPATFVPNYTAFDMYFKLSNGVVASEYTKHIHFSDAVIGATTIPSQSYTEDTASDFDFNITTSNVSPDADTFTATVTLAAPTNGTLATSSSFNASQYGSAFTENFNTSTGVLTITHTSTTDTILLSALRNLEFTSEEDFNSDFDMTVDLTYTGTVNGSSYTMAQQTVTVSGTPVAEISNPNTSHTFTEDTVYSFNSGGAGTYPQIIHPVNSNFTVVFTHAASTGSSPLYRNGTSGTVSNTSTTFTISGTKAEVNTALEQLYYAPAADDTVGETITFTVDRTSGDLTHETQSTGSLVMTATATGEYSISQVTNLAWNENVSKIFNSGLAITDTSTDDTRLPQHGSNYRLEIAMWYGASEYTDGTIVSNYTTNLTVGGVGNQNGQGDSNMISYTGPKDDVNLALADLRFIPNVDFTGNGPSVYYKIVRVQVSGDEEIVPQVSSTHTVFAVGTSEDAYSYTHQSNYDWNEDTPKLFDTGVQITDSADENSDYTEYNSTYTATFQLQDAASPYGIVTEASIGVLSTITGLTITHNNPTTGFTTVQGTKTQVNLALQDMKMIPDMDFIGDAETGVGQGSFFTFVSLQRDTGTVSLLDGSATSPHTQVQFNQGTDSPEYTTSATAMGYTEDLQSQSIFSASDIGITDAAADHFSNLTYEITVTISTAAGTFDTNSSNTITLGGSANISANTKASVNTALRALQFTPTVDYATDFDVTYSQTRYVNGASATTHATTQNVGTVTATPMTEFAYGTANSNIQYMVQDGAVATSVGQDLSPKNLTENWSKVYERPITITDTAVDGGTTNYKIVFTVPAGTTLYDNTDTSFAGTLDWDTRDNIHTKLSEGIRISGATADLSLSFTLYRKLGTNVEDTLGSGSISYTYLQNPTIVDSSIIVGNTNIGTTVLNSGDNIHAITSPLASTSSTDYQGDFVLDSGNSVGGYSFPTGISDIADIIDDIDVAATSSNWTKTKSSTTASKRLRIQVNAIASAVVTNTTANVTTHYGTTVSVSNIDLNQTYTHDLDHGVDKYSYSATTRDNPATGLVRYAKQSNYWDGTYMQLGYDAVDLSGDILSSSDTRAKRHVNDTPNGYWQRAIVSGMRGYFYGFRLDRDLSSGDVKINCHIKTTPSGTTQTPEIYTVKSSYSTTSNVDQGPYNASVSYSGSNCWVQEVKYDSTNNDIYVLCMLEEGVEAKYAIIAKLNWTGSAYAWSVIKEIQIGATTDYWATEAYLSDNFETLVTVQRLFSASNYTYDAADYGTSSCRRIRVYDKDEGGTNNWGIVNTHYWNHSSNDRGTLRQQSWVDVDSCAFNGVDKIITQGGAHIFEKNQGGTNNWGENTSVNLQSALLAIDDASGIYKFTKDYLVCVGRFSGGGSSAHIHEFQILDHNYNELTTPISLNDGTSWNSGAFGLRVRALEASREHNFVGVFSEYSNDDGNGNLNYYQFSLHDEFTMKMFYLAI